jgi:sulfate transport system permease protein
MNPIPGTRLALGVTLIYLSLVVLIPLSTVLVTTLGLTWTQFTDAAFSARALAAYRLSFGTTLTAAAINVVTGVATAWVLTRYDFPGRRLVDAIIDLPFALPTAVAGVALTTLYSSSTVPIAFTKYGIVIALTFVGLPFVVRTVQSVLADFPPDVEEAAITLGASPFQTFRRVLLPSLTPAILSGFGLAVARALGEYGSVAFISGNMPFRTELAPLLIMTKLEQFDYAGATAIALVMLLASFAILVTISAFERV